ncbi:MAG: hypothetical protein O3A51_00330 [Verrucomicrobia bacterium]|nr:hypothetical protein [Verrucomicrobiota bacterium]
MELTDEQKAAVSEWVAAGAGLSEVQRQLLTTFGISMTYMDVRFLVLDLNLQLKDKPGPKPAPEPSAPAGQPATEDLAGDAGQDGDALGAPVSGVRVEVDRITKPGSMVSGTVVFTDGVNATWALDQMGRLALGGSPPDYRPSDEDLQGFQDTLRRALETRGF